MARFVPVNLKKPKRCISCSELINLGSVSLEFERERQPYSEVEEKINGEGELIPMGSWYMCEKCGEIYLNLEALGYCLNPKDCMKSALKEYWELTEFIPPG